MPELEELLWLAIGTAYGIVGLALVILSRLVMDWVTPYRLGEELTKRDNPALGLAVTGYFAAVIVVFLGASAGGGYVLPTIPDAAAQLGIDVLYAVGGIAALLLSRVIMDRLVLFKFSMRKEIIDDRNTGAGAVEAGGLIATALVIAGALHGEGSVLTALAFYVAGQVVLVLFGLAYQMITRYDIHKQIESDNPAAGIAMGLNLVAVGLVLLKASAGEFVSWAHNFAWFGIYAVGGFVVLCLLRQLVDWLLLPGASLNAEIARDRSVNAAYIEGVMAVGAGAMIVMLF
jgi:uncharacterized membrane protein YjfL (UPF0719 family)